MIFRALFLAAMMAAAAWAQDLTFQLEDLQSSEATNADYQKGLSNLDDRQWDAAVANFDSAAKRDKSLADAALYWKAYALDHAGRWEESLGVIDKLQKSFPSSRWLKDAKALSMEIHADAGHPVNPASESDQDLKLLALNTLMQKDAQAALPALLKVINSDVTDRTKEHALFVLAQSDSPDARKALMDFARQTSNPDLQRSAVRMMGMVGGDGARKELAGLYSSSSNAALKREILNGMMLSGSKSQLLAVAKMEADSGLRNSAIANLSLTGGQAELSDLYKSGASMGEKTQILSSVYLVGDNKMLQDVLKLEKDPGSVLKNLYRTETNEDIRREVLDTLTARHDTAALEELARGEKDAHMKAEISRRLGTLK